VGIGLTVLTTITLVGWMAAPRTALGPGLPGVFRTAVAFWLVAHHAGFSVPGGRVGLLPLGLTVLPGALLYRSGGWVLRATGPAARTRVGVVHVALALAVPYTLLAGLLALAVRTRMVAPSVWQALVACFLLAFAAGGMGAARALVASRGRRVRSGVGALLKLLPERPRSVVMGVIGATSVLLACGAILVCASLAVHLASARSAYNVLAPGVVGGAILLLVELVYLPNAIVFAMAYAIGPGFSMGSGTSVSVTGVFVGAVPTFPPLAALPAPGPAPALSLVALAMPFVAGAVAGTLTVRAMPSPVYEAAPLWGFLSGALTGVVTALLAAVAGGPLGGGRMATVGPCAWQVGLMAAMEVGVAAAIAAWVSNWLLLRRPRMDEAKREKREAKQARKAAKRAAKAEKRRVGKRSVEKRSVEKRTAETRVAGHGVAGHGIAEAESSQQPRPGALATPRRAPVVSDDVEFVEPEPVLSPRRTARNTAPVEELEDLWEPDVPTPREREEPPVLEAEPVPDAEGDTGARIYQLRKDRPDQP
jgi:hypothetical protein